MKIRYSWSPRTTNPNEVTAVEIMSQHVPRQGDLVEISYIVDGEAIQASGRVKDVIWQVRKDPAVTVLLGR